MKRLLYSRQMLGKYRIERRLSEGGFAEVYCAVDTIEGVRVALKIAYPHLVDAELVSTFRHEVRIAAQLDHPSILPVKNAEFIDGHFVIVLPLGECALADRLKTRLSRKVALSYAEQMLSALAFAHRRRILHCDIKPENFILFPGQRIRLADFGIARIVLRTVNASGSGTLGYIAPEQAMGKPTYRSDVFSLGLILYRMFSGKLPEWPFERPYPGYERLRANLHQDFTALIDRATELTPGRRFENADQMARAFQRIKARALKPRGRRAPHASPRHDWSEVRQKQFLRQYRRLLEVRGECPHCGGPVAEPMRHCCWCGEEIKKYRGRARFTQSCPRCNRSIKSDWRFCPWCYGPSLANVSDRNYDDHRYAGRCHNPACKHKILMPHMRYCPWCRHKVRRNWPLPDTTRRCGHCKWGVADTFWVYCPWCGAGL